MKHFLFSLLFSFFPLFLLRKIPNRVHYYNNNYLKKDLNILKENTLISQKKIFINNGTDLRYELEESEQQKQLELLNIKNNMEKKKILDFLLDINNSDHLKLELLEKYSFLFYQEKGINKNFDEFLSS